MVTMYEDGRIEPLPEEWPEHAKLRKVSAQSHIIGEFLEWLLSEDSGLTLAAWDAKSEELVPAFPGMDDLLAKYHGINRELLEEEKEQTLQLIRRLQEGAYHE